MKTLELLDKYKKILQGLLSIEGDSIKFFLDGVEIGEIFDVEKKEGIINDWSVGKYEVRVGEKRITSFELYRMPHCCAIIVSCKAFVEPEFRNKRVGTLMSNLRSDIGRMLGYSVIMCTDVDTNIHQRNLLKTNGWKDVHNVVNKRTQNRVYLSLMNL